MSARVAAAVAALLATFPARAARAGDGVYGRLDGDVHLSVGAGPAIGAGGVYGGALLRALYLESCGLVATWVDALGTDRPLARSASLGVELRPLFLARWATNAERGAPWLDLATDSLGLSLGAAWSDRAHDGGHAGLDAAVSFGVPLGGRAAGPWLGARGALRWAGTDFAGGAPPPGDRGAHVLLTLEWHALVEAHLVDAGDALRR